MKNSSRSLLNNLKDVILQLHEQDFALSLPILSDSSIGKHARHILDLFECLIDSTKSGNLNYDRRKRCLETETNKEFALQKINLILGKINHLNLQKELLFQQKVNQVKVECKTTVERELLYNIEHCVHHLAIIRIGIEQNFNYVKIPENFGIAYSTLQNRELVKA